MNVLLIVYDNDSHINTFPLGTAYIARALIDAGHSVSIYNQAVYHYSEKHLTDYLNTHDFGAVGMGTVGGYYQYQKLLKISEAVNKSERDFVYILGGHGPSPEPEYFLKKTGADFIVLGEGEETIVELLARLDSPSEVRGVAFLRGGALVRTEDRPLIADVDHISYPAWDLFPIEHYVLLQNRGTTRGDRMLPILSGRGCPYQCAFCYRMEKGFRARSAKSIVDEMRVLKERYHITAVDFADELLMSSKGRVLELCDAFKNSGLGLKWGCSGRLNYATPDVLTAMKDAGCVFINYGIEAMDDDVLKKMNKCLTVRQIEAGVAATYTAGIQQGLNIIFGNVGDNQEVINKDVEFLLRNSTGFELRTLRPVTPYPGCPLYYKAIEDGKLKGVADFYENKHTNSDLLTVNFTNLTDDEFYTALKDANTGLANDYYEKNKAATLRSIDDLYDKKNAAFRGFRQV